MRENIRDTRSTIEDVRLPEARMHDMQMLGPGQLPALSLMKAEWEMRTSEFRAPRAGQLPLGRPGNNALLRGFGKG